MNEKWDELAKILKTSNNIVFFGGAGTSTESGIPDFRGKDGLYSRKYKGYDPEEILHIDFFLQNRKIFNEFLEEKMNFKNIKPNKGHLALVKLEQMGKLKAVITQNIDNLHQDAGSINVLELHGNISHFYCLACGKKEPKNFRCDCGGITRPPVTLYGENLDEEVTELAISAIKKADTLIVAGTSLTVYPAAYYIQYFKGKNLVIINTDETKYDQYASLVIRDSFAQVMDYAVNKLK
ncbi:NAD-dependent protein deacylase [Cetobacterium sp.]|uniref:NAD-dependent protein deacylase n=1 Tax=Cetobacterium sp. TaxID=2071632 RepID=UPI003EE76A29